MSLEKGKAEALQRVIDELRDDPGALMPIMQRAQDIFGYLPEEVQQYIAKEMDLVRITARSFRQNHIRRICSVLRSLTSVTFRFPTRLI